MSFEVTVEFLETIGTVERSFIQARNIPSDECSNANESVRLGPRKTSWVVRCRTPTVILTGITKYGVDLESAKLNAHIDYWDNLAGKEVRTLRFRVA